MTAAEQARLAADWATILQSEWAGLAADREVQEALGRAAEHLAQQAALLHAGPSAALAPAGAGADPPRPAGADAPPRPAADHAAPDTAGAAVHAGTPGGAAATRGSAPSLG